MNGNLEIYCLYASEKYELEILDNGWRSDIYVRKGEAYFQLNIYEIIAFTGSFKNELSEYGYYSIEPNLVLVEELTNENIRKTILGLDKDGYFSHIQPLPPNKIVNNEIEILPGNGMSKLFPLVV